MSENPFARLDEIEATSSDPGRNKTKGKRAFVRSLIGLAILLILILALGGLLLVKRMPGLRLRSRSAPTVEATEVVVAPTPEPATPTPLPVQTLTPLQLAISGPGTYPGSKPYVAEYRVTLVRGDAVTATVFCSGCLWSDGQSPQLTLERTSGEATFRAAILPQMSAQFTLVVDDLACTSWELSPAGVESPMQGTCAPATP